MQIQVEHAPLEPSFTFRASQSNCAITLPYVDPLSSVLEGQKIVLKGKAKRLLSAPLPHINSVELHYERISNVLIEAIELGALNASEVKTIISEFNDKTSARKVIHSIEVKIRNHYIADELSLIKNNAADIYEKFILLGFEIDSLDIADICYENETLILEFCQPLTICNYDDRNMPYPVQLCVAAIARYFGFLCSTSPADHFIDYSEDFDPITEIDKKAKKQLLAIDKNLPDVDYIHEFKLAMPTKQFNGYVGILESYYAYSLEEEDHHTDITFMMKESVMKLAFINADQFNVNNHYPIKSSNKLLSRVRKLAKKYKNTSLFILLNNLVDLMQIAHNSKNVATYDFEFDGDVFDLGYHQALTFKSLESDFMWTQFSESEKHIMETGDYARLIMDISSPSFMKVLRNHQLGWLLGHCLTQALSGYQNV